MKPKIKFMLDYSCSFLWTYDEETRKKYGFEIFPRETKEIGLSTATIQEGELIVDMFYDSLNPIYQAFPSFWREKLCIYFNKKVANVYRNICLETSDKFEIIDLTGKFSEDKRLSEFLGDPVNYCLQRGINFGDANSFIKELEEEQQKYLQYEELVLSDQLKWNESMILEIIWLDDKDK